MPDHANPPPDTPQVRHQALRVIEDDFPGWHTWVSVNGEDCYARRERSSPPRVFRAATPAGLRALIERDEEERR